MKPILYFAAFVLAISHVHAQDTPPAPEARETIKKALQPGFLGVSLESEDGKVVIKAVGDDTPAAKAGLKAGDALLSINGKALEGRREQAVDLIRSASPGDTIEIRVLRGDKEETVKATLGVPFDSGSVQVQEEKEMDAEAKRKVEDALREAMENSEKAVQEARRRSERLTEELKAVKERVDQELKAQRTKRAPAEPDGKPHSGPADGQLQKLAPEVPRQPVPPSQPDLRHEFKKAPHFYRQPDAPKGPPIELDPYKQAAPPPHLMLPPPVVPPLSWNHLNAIPGHPVPSPRGAMLDRHGKKLAERKFPRQQLRNFTPPHQAAPQVKDDAVWQRARQAVAHALKKAGASVEEQQAALQAMDSVRHHSGAVDKRRAKLEAEAAQLKRQMEALKAKADAVRAELEKSPK